MRFKLAKDQAQIAGNSQTITRTCNAIIGDFWLIDADQELISGSFIERRSPGWKDIPTEVCD